MSLIRDIAILALRSTQFDFQIRHPYSKKRLHLNSFRHKGYWYRGKSREQLTMRLFERLISDGDFVVEVGGHIGYVSQFYAHRVGPAGKVIVFEPGSDNLTYLRRNVVQFANIELVEAAISERTEERVFYTENLSGQNNSLLPDYEGKYSNLENTPLSRDNIEFGEERVACYSLDDFFEERKIHEPHFLKIDIEGWELYALKGMPRTLSIDGLRLMVEVSKNRIDCLRLLEDSGYNVYDEARIRVDATNLRTVQPNWFCFKEADQEARKIFCDNP